MFLNKSFTASSHWFKFHNVNLQKFVTKLFKNISARELQEEMWQNRRIYHGWFLLLQETVAERLKDVVEHLLMTSNW